MAPMVQDIRREMKTDSIVSVKTAIKYLPKIKSKMVRVVETPKAIKVPCLMPFSTLSNFFAPMF